MSSLEKPEMSKQVEPNETYICASRFAKVALNSHRDLYGLISRSLHPKVSGEYVYGIEKTKDQIHLLGNLSEGPYRVEMTKNAAQALQNQRRAFFHAPSKTACDHPVSFLSLPGEVRNQIYQNIFENEVAIITYEYVPGASWQRLNRRKSHIVSLKYSLNILLTCRQIEQEASSYLAGKNVFFFMLGDDSLKHRWVGINVLVRSAGSQDVLVRLLSDYSLLMGFLFLSPLALERFCDMVTDGEILDIENLYLDIPMTNIASFKLWDEVIRNHVVKRFTGLREIRVRIQPSRAVWIGHEASCGQLFQESLQHLSDLEFIRRIDVKITSENLHVKPWEVPLPKKERAYWRRQIHLSIIKRLEDHRPVRIDEGHEEWELYQYLKRQQQGTQIMDAQ